MENISMMINCFYEENMKYCDIIYIPNSINQNVDNLEKLFIKWLFDKSNNHKYWVIVDNKKLYCEYGTEAFVEWINETYFSNSNEKAFIKQVNATVWDKNNYKVIF